MSTKGELLSAPLSMKPQAGPATPYLRARQEWDDRLGGLYQQSCMWRGATFVSSSAAAVLAGALFIMVNKASVVPVIVGLDRERGEPVVIGPAAPGQFRPGPTEVRYFLTQLVNNVRGVPLDPVVMRKSWEHAYAYLTSDAATLMGEWARKPESNVSQIGKRTVTVQPIAITQVANSESYQARWQETVYDNGGRVLDEYTMTGLFTVVRKDPTGEEVLWMNPLGLYVSNFQWSRELTPERNVYAQRALHES